MPNKCQIELNKKWVCECLSDVTKEEFAWVLIQEPGFIGFGVVQSDKIWWPPNIPENSPDWTLTSDLRLFGEKGEWHVWRDWARKHRSRLLKFDEKNEQYVWIPCNGENQDNPKRLKEKREALTEYHALWGTEVACGKSSWIKLVEDRGAEIWIPPLEETELKDADLPLRLKLKQVIDYDPKYHLAGIVDAALVALVDSSCEEVLTPAASLFCPEPETVG